MFSSFEPNFIEKLIWERFFIYLFIFYLFIYFFFYILVKLKIGYLTAILKRYNIIIFSQNYGFCIYGADFIAKFQTPLLGHQRK